MTSINQFLIVPIFLCLCMLNPLGMSSSQEVYCNNRFDFCLEYPSEIFEKKVLSTNGDGVELYSLDGNIVLNASGGYNILGSSIEEEFELFKEYLASQEKDFKIFSADIEADRFILYASFKNEIQYQETRFLGSEFVSISIHSKMPTIEASKIAIENIISDLVLSILL